MDWNSTGVNMRGMFKLDNQCKNKMLNIIAGEYIEDSDKPFIYKWSAKDIMLSANENPPHPVHDNTAGVIIEAQCVDDEIYYFGEFLHGDCPMCLSK